MGFIDKVKETLHDTAASTRDGIEGIRTRHELAEAYADLGRRTVELMDTGTIDVEEIRFDCDRIRVLRAEVLATDQATGIRHADRDAAGVAGH
jgi:hypothetical protein